MSMGPRFTLYCITLAFTNWRFHIQRVHTGLCLGSNRRDYGNNVGKIFIFFNCFGLGEYLIFLAKQKRLRANSSSIRKFVQKDLAGSLYKSATHFNE